MGGARHNGIDHIPHASLAPKAHGVAGAGAGSTRFVCGLRLRLRLRLQSAKNCGSCELRRTAANAGMLRRTKTKTKDEGRRTSDQRISGSAVGVVLPRRSRGQTRTTRGARASDRPQRQGNWRVSCPCLLCWNRPDTLVSFDCKVQDDYDRATRT
jgi:hypothetical protein